MTSIRPAQKKVDIAGLWAFCQQATSQASVNNGQALRSADFRYCARKDPFQATDSHKVSSGVSGKLSEADDTWVNDVDP